MNEIDQLKAELEGMKRQVDEIARQFKIAMQENLRLRQECQRLRDNYDC